MHGLLTTTKRMQCFALRLRVVPCGGGQDTAGTIGIRGNNAFATDESRTSSLWQTSKLCSLLARLAS